MSRAGSPVSSVTSYTSRTLPRRLSSSPSRVVSRSGAVDSTRDLAKACAAYRRRRGPVNFEPGAADTRTRASAIGAAAILDDHVSACRPDRDRTAAAAHRAGRPLPLSVDRYLQRAVGDRHPPALGDRVGLVP